MGQLRVRPIAMNFSRRSRTMVAGSSPCSSVSASAIAAPAAAIVAGGSRCAPCFRLARWIEDHHATLDKDYVFVKLMDGIDEHVTEALAGLPTKEGDGLPWFAITEPDGNVLAVSRGPMGNIGFPSSTEEIRHFRRMLEGTVRKMTSDDVDRLIKSLTAGQ